MITPWYDEPAIRPFTQLTNQEVRELLTAQPWRARQYPEWAERLAAPAPTDH